MVLKIGDERRCGVYLEYDILVYAFAASFGEGFLHCSQNISVRTGERKKGRRYVTRTSPSQILPDMSTALSEESIRPYRRISDITRLRVRLVTKCSIVTP